MLVTSKTHQGLTGYWMGQYNGSGVLERKTSFVIVANSAPSGGATQKNFTPAGPTPKLLP
jgi:hypothetical protein